MRKLLYPLCIFSMVLPLCADPLEDALAKDKSEKLTYTITVSLDWNTKAHPVNFPSGAHFSPLVLVSHAEEGALFAPGTLASPGLELQAEIGATTILKKELDDTLIQKKVGNVDIGPWRGRARASRRVSFVLSQKFHRLSATTMIAPSPDWFLGIDVSLRDDEGKFVDELTIPLHMYDAGTEDGRSFSFSNPDTEPQMPIRPLPERYFIPDGKNMIPLGTITLIRNHTSSDATMSR